MSDDADTTANATRVSDPAGGNGQANCVTVTQLERVADLLAKFALTDAEVGRLLGVPKATVLNLHRTGALRALKIGGRCCWRPADVERFVEGLEVDG